MKLNILQIIFIGICVAITIYFTYATINLIVTGDNIIDLGGGETVTLSFLDYGMIQFYIFMGVMAFLLFMLAGGGAKE
ncbi:MAG: hypothetical protein HWN65_06545 [Candidatus Helarchaeota archaeon]|nr:hypothetical protein [Candidatus Helarchaeota archaeon]